jgi:hypothetical protein
MRARLTEHRRSILVLLPLLLVGGVVQAVGMDAAPQRLDDEGTYVAQAWAVEHLGTLAHYTYWYDHPPVGWLQLAGYTTLTDAFDRASNAVVAGREFMLLLQLVSMVLLWVLGRRLGLQRAGAALAVVLFSLSPLAVQFHRTVFLDNIATPWILASLVLALSPKGRLAAYAGSGVCFALAVLSKETSLLALPVLAWLLWRETPPATRRYAVSVAGSLFLLVAGAYVLYAAVKGELLPSPGRTSLADGVAFQLVGRAGSGSVFTAGSPANATVDQWLALDPVFCVLAPLAAVVAAVLLPRWRPIAAGLLVLLAVMLRPGGYLPVPFVIALLPFGALLIAAVLQTATDALRTERPEPRPVPLPRLAAAGLGGALALGLVAGTPSWAANLAELTGDAHDRPMVDAEAWIARNVERGDRLVVDDALWVDLTEQGRPLDDVVWYYKVDTDPAVVAAAPRGWRDYQWLVSTQSFRSQPETVGPVASAALDHSILVARFGDGDDRVEVRRIVEDDVGGVEADLRDRRLERRGGRELLANPAVRATPEAEAALADGAVDTRLLTALAAVAGHLPLDVRGFPTEPGERAADVPLLRVDLAASPAGADRLRAFLRHQEPPFAPESVTTHHQGDRTVLRVTYDLSLH